MTKKEMSEIPSRSGISCSARRRINESIGTIIAFGLKSKHFTLDRIVDENTSLFGETSR
jgi:hypothetical protein